jgi:hypothetical protein
MYQQVHEPRFCLPAARPARIIALILANPVKGGATGVRRGVHMTRPETVIIAPSLVRLLRTLIVGNLLMVGGILGIAVGLVGIGNWTIWACVAAVGLTTGLHLVAAIRKRPRLLITCEGFVFEKLIGSEAHRWDEIDGKFAVIKIGLSEAVAFNLTPEHKARIGKKPTSLFAGYDAAVVGSAMPCSASALADLLNEHKQRHAASGGRVPSSESISQPEAAADRPRD